MSEVWSGGEDYSEKWGQWTKEKKLGCSWKYSSKKQNKIWKTSTGDGDTMPWAIIMLNSEVCDVSNVDHESRLLKSKRNVLT